MEIPTILAGHYQIVNHLGSGGFGQTFLARDLHLPSNSLCVVKQLKPKIDDSGTLEIAKRLFNQEAETLYKLGDRHDQIPRLMAHFEQDSEFYLVQELIEGITLEDELAGGKRMSEVEAIELLLDVLHVLSFIHQQNVIHRDIKPSNLIRRDRDRKIVLIDFGAVKKVNVQTGNPSSQTSSNTVAVGSPGYMPSEQISGQPHFSSDIYAVGMLCFQVLTGLLPKQLPRDTQTGEYSWSLCSRVLAENGLGSVTISTGFANILDRLVRYDYRQRYENASDALETLEKLISQTDSDIANQSTILSIGKPQDNSNHQSQQPTSILGSKELSLQKKEKFSNHQIDRQEYRNRQILLNKVKNFWVKGVLETSLHSKVLIELGLEDQSFAVERPWSVVWQSEERLAQALPLGTKILDKLNEMGAGRSLLILGNPGSGKTTTLLELARDLIAEAEKDVNKLIPVVFNLSSWTNEKQSIADWLIQELHIKYQVAKEIGKSWIETQQLFLLLDGLDEVSIKRRDICLQALNQFTQSKGQTELVVCSRIEDYKSLSHRLRVQGAICIQPLTFEQVDRYLISTGSNLEGVSTAIRTDETLQELVRSPLLLSIMTLAYQDLNSEILLQAQESIDERRKHLFDTYIQRMFDRQILQREYSKEKTIFWLSWLAKQLLLRSQTVFLIERIQPDWLNSIHKKWIYSICLGLFGAASIGLVTGVNLGLVFDIQTGLVGGIFLGIGGGLIAGVILGLVQTEIHTVETLKWSFDKAKNTILVGGQVGLSVGILLVLGINFASFSLHWAIPTLMQNLSYGLGGLGTGLIFILLQGLAGSTIETNTAPNQGIWRSLQNSLLFTIIGAITLGLVALQVGFRSPTFGILIGILFGTFSPAGLACLQHFVLRLVLYQNSYIPWNLERFLNYATKLIFLQKVGGGYIFIHRLLLEHFAQMSLRE
ncbi:MAG: hypothetical protein DCF19_17305 [Pseudanabaena frigida]|uniref:non-specific serine/threonine protein kinase n=1 Tax=Pseudanabaena frigida TaxID=945775 RepID=A0A2W4VYQ5_9CYAN|nr:MAG: hypothetical protein DCF19_17305 [Pseudanabaena frigida]